MTQHNIDFDALFHGSLPHIMQKASLGLYNSQIMGSGGAFGNQPSEKEAREKQKPPVGGF